MRGRTESWSVLKVRNEARCRRILDNPLPLELDDLEWARVGGVELDAGVLTSLAYMRDVEGFTDSYLVGLGAHRTTLADPLVHRFLDVWRAEEAGHTSALDAYLTAYSDARGTTIAPRQPPPSTRPHVHERVAARVGGAFGRTVTAAHMTWGAANELLTLNGYRLLAERVHDPVLVELLRRIAAQESRHYSFYLLQAEWRLAASPLARAALRHTMRRAWTPVGIGDGYKTEGDFGRVLEYLRTTEDAERVIDRMDSRFARLPGLSDLRIYRRAATAFA